MKEILDHLINSGLPDGVFYVVILAYAALKAWQYFGKSAESDTIDRRFVYSENARIVKLLELDRLQRACDRSVVDVDDELKVLRRLHSSRNNRTRRLGAQGDRNGFAFLLGAALAVVLVSILVFLSGGVGPAFGMFIFGLIGIGIVTETFELDRIRGLSNPVPAFIVGVITGILPYVLVSILLSVF